MGVPAVTLNCFWQARHAQVGAHYTPRAYVERLVMPTVIEPLRAEWADAQAAALTLAREATEMEANPPAVTTKKDLPTLRRHETAVEAKWDEARQQVRAFLHRLCTLRVLDPACGSANFLYVTLEHLKRLEGEVLNQLTALGDTQDALDLGRETVSLLQLRGVELNERAAALAELVLWIGYLQWHIRTNGQASVRWLRPEFQRQLGQGEQVGMETDLDSDADEMADEATPAKAVIAQRPWPTGLTEQIKAVAEVMGRAAGSLDLEGLAAHFSGRGRWRERLPTLMETLVVLGRVRVVDGRWVDVRS